MYDLIFLGGGPGGYEGAIAAAKQGLKTAVIEKNRLGGTCLQWGCVPTKTLLHAVKMLKYGAAGKKYGITYPGSATVDPVVLAKQKNRVVSKLTRGIEFLFKENGIDLFNAMGTLTAPDTVTLESGEQIRARNIVLATGSRPAELPFLTFDNPLVMGSRQALELEEIPKKLLVVGAGAIGLEMGQIYRYLGSEVTVVELMDQVVPGSDPEIAAVVQKELKKQKIKIHTETKTTNVDFLPDQGGVELTFQQNEKEWQECFSKVLLSVGRRPMTDRITDPALDLELDSRGFVKTGANLQTSIPGVFACGDVAGPPLLAHKASHEAKAIVDFIVHKKEIGKHPVPAAVFTDPEMSSVGLSEPEARERFSEVKVGRFPYAAGSRANAIDDKAGLVKIIAGPDQVIVGAHIVGSEAAELTPILTLAVHRKMTAADFKDMIFVHPTLSENIWEAAGLISGHAIHL